MYGYVIGKRRGERERCKRKRSRIVKVRSGRRSIRNKCICGVLVIRRKKRYKIFK